MSAPEKLPVVIPAMMWQPVEEYRAEHGRVVVWLEWRHYLPMANAFQSTGEFQSAYAMEAGGQQVWVTAHDSIPIETGGRRVTHFAVPLQPQVVPVSADEKPPVVSRRCKCERIYNGRGEFYVKHTKPCPKAPR